MSSWLNRITNSPQVRAVRQATENLPPGARAAAKAGATGVAVGAAVFAVPPLLGFTTAGVAAGSLAAAIQSAVYGAAVPTGSIFAIMQSLGATATIVPAVVAGAAAAAGAGAVGGGGRGGGGVEGNGDEGPHNGPEGGPDAGRGGSPHISKKRSQSPESASEQDQQGVTADSSDELPPYEGAPAESSIQVLALEDQVDELNRGSGGDELVRLRNNAY
ncbi:hypothetical protein BDV93DRAFT_607683 [Ceratobasidium sp. AG-I]|nr:hypothetical protein BDV93DRAFT_607683 [Ceratobasidium sp. AG-I]